MATLRTFDEKVKTESVAEKRAEIDKKVDERIATDRRKILEEKRALMQKKNEKEKLLGLLQEKQGFGDLVCSFCFAFKILNIHGQPVWVSEFKASGLC